VSPRVLVAGIGNVFLGDDGFGVEVARRLAARPQPEGVAVADIGIRALHLAYALLDRPGLLVVIDAVQRGEPPGTLCLIDPELASIPAGIPDAHSMNLQTVLAALRNLGGEPPPIRIVGCEPAFIGEEMGLSPLVARAVPRALQMVRAAIARELANAASAAEETAP
jgi:hydrogenase maturation protease